MYVPSVSRFCRPVTFPRSRARCLTVSCQPVVSTQNISTCRSSPSYILWRGSLPDFRLLYWVYRAGGYIAFSLHTTGSSSRNVPTIIVLHYRITKGHQSITLFSTHIGISPRRLFFNNVIPTVVITAKEDNDEQQYTATIDLRITNRVGVSAGNRFSHCWKTWRANVLSTH